MSFIVGFDPFFFSLQETKERFFFLVVWEWKEDSYEFIIYVNGKTQIKWISRQWNQTEFTFEWNEIQKTRQISIYKIQHESKNTKKLVMAGVSDGGLVGLFWLMCVHSVHGTHAHMHTQVDVSYSLDIQIVYLLDCRCGIINFYQTQSRK